MAQPNGSTVGPSTQPPSVGSSGSATLPVEKAPVVLEIDTEKLQDPSYLKTYFSKMDQLLTPYSENPTRLFHDLTIHIQDAVADTSNIFAETLLQGHLVRLVQTVLERRYPWTTWCEAAVDLLRLVVETIPKLIALRYHPEETLRTLEKVFTRRFVFYQSHGWNDATDEQRPKYFPSNQEASPDQPELYATVLPTEQSPSYWFLEMITAFGPAWDVIVARIADEEHQLDANRMYQMLKVFELIRNDLRKPYLLQVVPRLAEVVMAHISRFSDADLRSQNFDDILDSLNAVSKLASRVRLLKLSEEIEFFKLPLAVRTIQLPYLEARLKGIDQIKHIIQVAKGEAHYSSRARPRRQQGAVHPTASLISGSSWQSSSSYASRAGPSRGSRSDGGSEEDSPDDTTTSTFSAGDIATTLGAAGDEPFIGPVISNQLYDPNSAYTPPHEEELITFPSDTASCTVEDDVAPDDTSSASTAAVQDEAPSHDDALTPPP